MIFLSKTVFLSALFAIAAVLSSCNGSSSSNPDGGIDSSTDTDTDSDTDTDTEEPTCWWEPMDSGIEANLWHIWGLSPEKIYTGGLDYSRKEGVILEYNGEAWVEKWSFGDRSIGSSWGTAEDDLYFQMSIHEWVGDEINITGGTVSHWDGFTWTDTGNLGAWDLFGFATDDLFSVASSIRHYNGTDWSLIFDNGDIPGEPKGSAEAMWGAAPDDMFFVGSTSGPSDGGIPGDYVGFMMHYDGVEFTEIPTTSDILYDIHGVSADEIYAVGNDYYNTHASVLKYNGYSWSTIGSFDDQDSMNKLVAVWASETGEVFVVGYVKIYHYDGDEWEIFETPPDQFYLRDIWGSDLDHLFVVGGTTSGTSVILKYTCPD